MTNCKSEEGYSIIINIFENEIDMVCNEKKIQKVPVNEIHCDFELAVIKAALNYYKKFN